LKNKGFKEGGVTTMRLDDLGKSTTLESNKSQDENATRMIYLLG
jgi:hypothetical protein